MNVDVVFLPQYLKPGQLQGRAVVVFDVLRATTTMTAALAVGVTEIHVYPDTASARAAKEVAGPGVLLAGEERCLPPKGFDLGNSPGAFERELHAGRRLIMSTTNGTRAILAARSADRIFAGALVNATAVARALRETGRDVTLLAAGTGGAIAIEDLLGAGAVLAALTTVGGPDVRLQSDAALVARRLWARDRDDVAACLRESLGGRNVIDAGLAGDIDFAARVDAFDVVGVIQEPARAGAPVVRPATEPSP